MSPKRKALPTSSPSRRTRSNTQLLDIQEVLSSSQRLTTAASSSAPLSPSLMMKTRAGARAGNNGGRSHVGGNREESVDQSSEEDALPVIVKPRRTRNSTIGRSKVIVQITVSPRRRRKISPEALERDAPLTPAKRRRVHETLSPSKEDTDQFVVFSPVKKAGTTTPYASPGRRPRALPEYLHPCLSAQRRAILRALSNLADGETANYGEDQDDKPTNTTAFEQINELLKRTVTKDESNSCLILGPRGSGKSDLVNRCLSSLPNQPIVIHLSGWLQNNDRLAMREIARQLALQTGKSFLPNMGEEEVSVGEEEEVPLPNPSNLPALISVLPTLSRPSIVVIDGFDLFALHPRQALLYCLLDTVQSCHARQGHKGVAIIGVTTRMDTINLLEKRVKSRFSGRMIRTAPPRSMKDWIAVANGILRVDAEGEGENREWKDLWNNAIEEFLSDRAVMDRLADTFALSRDIRLMCRLLTNVVLGLSPPSPFPTASSLNGAIESQRSRHRFPSLSTLSYPAICLLIACVHSRTMGHEAVTFEMLYDHFYTQVRASSSAPIQVDGGSIGMVKCTREMLMGTFEQLVQEKIFVSVVPPSSTVAKEFVRYRCILEASDVRKAVDVMGKTNLRKWLTKAP